MPSGYVDVNVTNTAVMPVVASSTGGAQPVAQSSTPWIVVASTTGGSQPVSAAQSSTPWVVVASTTGGAQPVVQSATPWVVVSSTTGGSQPVSVQNVTLTVVSTTTAGSGGLVSAQGMAAEGAAVSGNPVYAGGEGRTTNPTAVSDGQAVGIMTDDVGRQVVVMGHVRDLVAPQTQNITTTSEYIIVTAGGAGVFNDITSLAITNRTATACNVTLKDSSGGTTRAIYDLAANGGIVLAFAPPMPQSGTSAAWTLTLSAPSITLDANVVYVKNV